MNLRYEFQRPVMYLPNLNIDALIDTGSLFPVWCATEKSLQELGGEKISDAAPFGGFGGMAHGKMYRLPTFILGKLIYPHFNIIACEYATMIVPLILPATMFGNLIYEIDNKPHGLNVTIPDDESPIRNMIIKSENGRLHVLCSSADT